MINLKVNIDVDNKDKILKELDEKARAALEAIGAKAETIASGKCPTDTGLLKNSITHAISGEGTAITSYKADRADKTGDVKSGGYTGTAGKSKDMSVYVGTNVEYAAYVELGTSHQDPQPFLEPAITGYGNTYKELAEKILKGD